MKHTFKADPDITVTVEVTPKTEAHFGQYLSRLDAIQLGSQTLMLHAQALSLPVDAEGEEVEHIEDWEERNALPDPNNLLEKEEKKF